MILTIIPSPPSSCEYIFKRFAVHEPTEGLVQHRESYDLQSTRLGHGQVCLGLIITAIILEIITVVITVLITGMITVIIMVRIIIIVTRIMFGHFWELLRSEPYEGLRYANRTD